MIDKKLCYNKFETFLTRTKDVECGNVSERAKKCAEAGCDFALSVHFNGFDDKSAKGTEVYVPYEEKVANIEVSFKKVLTSYFKERKPFARSCGPVNKNNILDKKMNSDTKRFEAFESKKDYFGFIRTAWEKGLSADLIEICFLTNQNDFDVYIKNKEEIADGLAKAIVEGFGKTYKKEVANSPKPKINGSGKLNKNKLDLKL